MSALEFAADEELITARIRFQSVPVELVSFFVALSRRFSRLKMNVVRFGCFHVPKPSVLRCDRR